MGSCVGVDAEVPPHDDNINESCRALKIEILNIILAIYNLVHVILVKNNQKCNYLKNLFNGDNLDVFDG